MTTVYPVVMLITEAMKERGLTRKEVCHSLGYSNPGKAFQLFDGCIMSGANAGSFFVEKLARVIQVDVERLKQAFDETQHLKVLEAKAKARAKGMAEFTPHLWVEPERAVPSPIFAVAFCGERPFRYAALPDGITNLPFDEQQAIVRHTIHRHFAENNGGAGPFGSIMAYRYRVTYDDYWRVSVTGEFGELIHGEPVLHPCTLTIGGKTIETGRDGLFAMFTKTSGSVACN